MLVLLVSGQSLSAEEKAPSGVKEQAPGQSASGAQDANNADESWWRKWDIPVKDPNNPNEVMTAKWNAVLKVLQAKELEQKTKEKIMDKLISPVFDFPLMGQLAVGRTHWPKLNAAQREKFTRLFVERLKTSYREKVSLYTDEKVQFKPAIKKDKTMCYIPMELVSKDKKVTILHKLRKGDDKRWKVYDVEIQGVSILLTYRSQFEDILQKGTVENLLARLEEPPTP